MLIQDVHTLTKWFQWAEWLSKVQQFVNNHHKITNGYQKALMTTSRSMNLHPKTLPRCFRRINFNWWNGWPFWPWHHSWTASALWDWESWTRAEGGKRIYAGSSMWSWRNMTTCSDFQLLSKYQWSIFLSYCIANTALIHSTLLNNHCN